MFLLMRIIKILYGSVSRAGLEELSKIFLQIKEFTIPVDIKFKDSDGAVIDEVVSSVIPRIGEMVGILNNTYVVMKIHHDFYAEILQGIEITVIEAEPARKAKKAVAYTDL